MRAPRTPAMARIRVRAGQHEVEIDSRDLHIDNETMGQVVSEVSGYLKPSMRVLGAMPDAEAFEPEFEPVRVGAGQLGPRLESLEGGGFFGRPRTASETVEQLRGAGWAASPLDVSRGLARMAMARRLSRGAEGYVTPGART